jgi:DNA mismatch repair protein MutS2
MAVDLELRLRRLTVDEALPKLDHYLNAAFMAGLPSVRIVHGKGTGVLRQAVHETLAEHPLVKSFRLGGCGEGDFGVTIVELVNH